MRHGEDLLHGEAVAIGMVMGLDLSALPRLAPWPMPPGWAPIRQRGAPTGVEAISGWPLSPPPV